MRLASTIVAATLLLSCCAAHAATLVATDFTGRTVAGTTASNISYTLNGVADPGNLTAVEIDDITPASFFLTTLFDTANAQGRFAPDLNTGNENNWSVSVPIALTASSLLVDQVALTGTMYSNTGVFQGASRTTDVQVSIVGSTSGQVASQTLSGTNSGGGASAAQAAWSNTYSLGSTIELTNAETWELVVTTTNAASTGNNTGLDSFSVDGTAANQPVVLFTDFDGRTVSGNTAQNLTWIANGVSDPGDVSADFNLFDTADAQDRFAVERNIQQDGPWQSDVSFTVGGEAIDLDEVSMDVFIYNGSGDLQTANRDVDITVELLDNSLSVLDTVSVLNIYPQNESAPDQPQLITLDFSGNTLTAGADYTFRIIASSDLPQGNNAGIDNFLVTGTAAAAVPEPASAAMLLMATLLCGTLSRGRLRRQS